MKRNLLAFLVLAIVALFLLLAFRHPVGKNQTQAELFKPVIKSNTPAALPQSAIPLQSLSKLKTRWSDFSDAEKGEFTSNFVARYQPALEKWCGAFSNRVPFSPASLTANNMVERIGTRPIYREYIFVVDGITLGIQDANGVARVDYLNDPKQTGKMTMLPSGGEAPISSTPVSKEELATMFSAEGGTQFMPNDIRLIPSGYSGALNGGAIVNVGGTPDNAASWKYDMVIAPDGKLAYYLRGK
jgi:hypothetical protein